jgi:hypothetical protein
LTFWVQALLPAGFTLGKRDLNAQHSSAASQRVLATGKWEFAVAEPVPIRRAGLWSPRLEHNGPQRQPRRIDAGPLSQELTSGFKAYTGRAAGDQGTLALEPVHVGLTID